ncbi:MAG: 3-hydroxyacyl-CoA dehydrogenase family protein, partial [Halobacteriaceae archaeon]
MRVCVLGAGTMGHGIAQVTAMAGNDVSLRDVEESLVSEGLDAIASNLDGALERDKITPEEKSATLDRIEGTTDLEQSVDESDLVIEAVPENLELKQEVLSEAADLAPKEAIIASNTSSLSVTEIAAEIQHPGRVVGLHFFNPVHIMDLVEVVEGEQTSDETLSFAADFVEDIDKTPITIKDTPGFATSRLGVALGVEAMRMVQEGVASPRDIDRAMEL